jgi:hypothetical protein
VVSPKPTYTLLVFTQQKLHHQGSELGTGDSGLGPTAENPTPNPEPLMPRSYCTVNVAVLLVTVCELYVA